MTKQATKKSPEEEKIITTGRVEDLSIVDEMKTCYLDYAMSVIVSRALPDVRDGLKPVHRRILYAMWTLGLKPQARFRKSATVVGEVLGKYHPHGDTAVYGSLVRMAQDFSLRYPLVNGQGNFGSMDGDSAAAMRYTETKLANISEEMLSDIEKETVKFIPNYDGSQTEPTVMPATLPNLLLNGTIGIAVGMATNIPPHNLGELIDGIHHLIDNSDASIEDLMKFVKGPDFPTGATIFDIQQIKQAYTTGKGSIAMRAKTEIVENKNGMFQIIATEIPYQVNKASLLEKIAELVKTKKIEAIKDLRDESNKNGVRIVVDLKKEAYPKKVLNQLFKHTQLQESFHVNMLALIDGIQPRVLSLKTILEEYIKHRQEIVRARTQFDLNKAKARAHILEGLMMALDKIDAVIKIIRESRDKEIAKVNLMKRFKFSEIQAIAILEMRLQNLANLEKLKIENELEEKKKLVKELESILNSPKKILTIIKTELTKIKEKFSDDRRTEIVKSAIGKFSAEDLVPNESTIVIMTNDGYIKRLPPETFKAQGRGGKGVIGLTTKEEDRVEFSLLTNTHTDLLFFTTKGRVFQLKSYELPSASRTSKGQALINFLQLEQTEKVTAVLPLDQIDKTKYLVMATNHGLIKRVNISDFANVRRSGLIAIKLKNDDSLGWVKSSTGQDDIVLISSDGQAIRFKENKVRTMGRAASGVRGIRLKPNDYVVGIGICSKSMNPSSTQLLIVMENGFGKRSPLKQYKIQGRGGSGIKTAKITTRTGKIISARVIDAEENKEKDLLIISKNGQVIRMPFKSVNLLGRVTQGVKLMRFKTQGDEVANVTIL